MSAPQHGMQEDNVKANVTLWGLFKKLLPYFMRQKFYFFSTLIAVAIIAIGGRFIVWLFGKAVDIGILQHDHDTINKIAAAYLVLEILLGFANFAHMFFFA